MIKKNPVQKLVMITPSSTNAKVSPRPQTSAKQHELTMQLQPEEMQTQAGLSASCSIQSSLNDRKHRADP